MLSHYLCPRTEKQPTREGSALHSLPVRCSASGARLSLVLTSSDHASSSPCFLHETLPLSHKTPKYTPACSLQNTKRSSKYHHSVHGSRTMLSLIPNILHPTPKVVGCLNLVSSVKRQGLSGTIPWPAAARQTLMACRTFISLKAQVPHCLVICQEISQFLPGSKP